MEDTYLRITLKEEAYNHYLQECRGRLPEERRYTKQQMFQSELRQITDGTMRYGHFKKIYPESKDNDFAVLLFHPVDPRCNLYVTEKDAFCDALSDIGEMFNIYVGSLEHLVADHHNKKQHSRFE